VSVRVLSRFTVVWFGVELLLSGRWLGVESVRRQAAYASICARRAAPTLIASTCPAPSLQIIDYSPPCFAPSSNTLITSTRPSRLRRAVERRLHTRIRSSTFTPKATSPRTSTTSPLDAASYSVCSAGVPARPPACAVLAPPPLPTAAAQLALWAGQCVR
jgi:hypothetical protein